MKTFRVLVVVGLWAGLVAGSRAEDPAKEGAASVMKLLDQAIEAHGGAKNLTKYPASMTKMKGTIQLMGAEIGVSGTTYAMLPDKLHNALALDVNGQQIEMVQIVNGTKASQAVAGMKLPLDDKAKSQLMGTMELLKIMQFVPLKDAKKYELKMIEAEKGLVGLSVTPKNGEEVKLYFDAKTYLVKKVVHKALDEQMQEVDEEWIQSDYKDVDGVKMAMKTELKREGKAFGKLEVTEVKNLEKVDPAQFDLAD